MEYATWAQGKHMLIIHGECDPEVPVIRAEDLKRQFSEAEKFIIAQKPNGIDNHFLQEQSELVYDLVFLFLQKHIHE
jgi:hypothetical protein